MSFKAYTSGLPDSAVKLISDGVSSAFGDIEMVIIRPKEDIVAIRQAAEDDTVVFVCFDSVSSSTAEAFENGLFSSEKYHQYVSGSALATYLNEYFGSDLEVPEDQSYDSGSGVSSGDMGDLAVMDSILDEDTTDMPSSMPSIAPEYSGDDDNTVYVNVGSGDDALIIHNLREEVSELQRLYEGDEYPESEPDQETLDKIFNLESEVRELTTAKSIVDNRVAHYEKSIKGFNRSIGKLESKVTDLNKEKTQRERTLSTQAGQLREKDLELTQLRGVKAKLDSAQSKIEQYKNQVTSLTAKIGTLDEKISVRDGEITSLQSQVDAAGSTETRLVALQREIEGLKKSLETKDSHLEEAQEEIEELESRLVGTGSLDDEVANLETRNKNLEKDLVAVQTELLEMTNEKNRLQLSQDTYHENLDDIKEQRRMAEFSSSTFKKLEETSLPRESPAEIDLGSVMYPNIVFVFSGSAESQARVFKQIRGIAGNFDQRGIRGLIADFSVDSIADYDLGTMPKQGSLDWLATGGDIKKLVTPVRDIKSLEFVSLIPEGFVNDSYLLSVDWGARLQELNATGYRSIVYLGSISTLVGRVLFNSVAGRGVTRVYTMGSLLSARSVHQNLSGLKQTKRTKIYFYDMYEMSKVEKIIESVEKLGFPTTVVSRLTRGKGRAS